MTAAPTARVASMMRNDAVLGSTCRTMMRGADTPMNRAARTNCSSLSEIVRDRTTRAEIIQPKTASSPTNATQPPLRSRGETIAMMRNEGNTSSRSTTRTRTRSVQPPA
jgi:hypothetical protein